MAALDAEERALADRVAERRDEIVALACELIAYDTTSREDPAEPPRQETELQDHPAERLRAPRLRSRRVRPRSCTALGPSTKRTPSPSSPRSRI